MDQKTIKRLEEELDESAIETRETDYGEVDYIKSNFAIQQANDIFNYDWSGKIVDLQKLSEEEFTKDGKTYYNINFICRYQVMVDGESNEDVGFGSSTQGNKSSATETAVKSAVSDAIKRSLRHYGNQFGLS
ncbi:MAG: Rad52/Rad22 family DNA repair protein, partial [Promethearchaeota archaeon]